MIPARAAALLAFVCMLTAQVAHGETLYVACSLTHSGDIALYSGVIKVDWDKSYDANSDYVQGLFTVEPSLMSFVDSTWFTNCRLCNRELWAEESFQVPRRPNCGTPTISAMSFYGGDPSETGGQDCWNELLCYLGVSASPGGRIVPAGLNGDYYCSDCITLWASPDTGYQFDGWSGSVSSSDPVVNLCLAGSDKFVIANFSPVPRCQLTVSASSGGYISPNPSGSYECGASFTAGAIADAGYHFTCWDGDIISESTTVSGVLSHDMYLVAYFDLNPDPLPPPPSDCSADWVSGCSPIVFNLSAGTYQLTGADSPVYFDISATGTLSKIGWTAAGADEAFLCLDRNQNGYIDSGGELFGNATRLKNGSRAANGFIALAEYDDNGDGVIDSRDQIWFRLLLWRDLNHDGISQPSELVSLAGSSVTAIGLSYYWTGRHDTFGNLLKYRGNIWLNDRGKHASARPAYDIFFVHVP